MHKVVEDKLTKNVELNFLEDLFENKTLNLFIHKKFLTCTEQSYLRIIYFSLYLRILALLVQDLAIYIDQTSSFLSPPICYQQIFYNHKTHIKE